jgi:hypothetical protein
VTPFPAGGVYVPVIGEYRDGERPIWFYDLLVPALGLFGPDVAPDEIAPGLLAYDYSVAMSLTTDAGDADRVGYGTMSTTDLGGGQFATCWSLGCTADPESLPWLSYPQFGAGPLVFTEVSARAYQGAPASTGMMTATAVDGGFQIDSFFDIFIELCLAGCNDPETATWDPTLVAVHYELFDESQIPAVPEPATLLLLGSGLCVVARGYRVRMARKLRSTTP